MACVALLVLAARVAYLAFASGSVRLHSDAAQYDALARPGGRRRLRRHLSAARPSRHRVPTTGLPGAASVFYRAFGPSVGLARGLDVGIGVLVVVTAMLLASRELGSRAALATGLVLVLAPNLVANDTWVGADSLSLLLILALVLGAARSSLSGRGTRDRTAHTRTAQRTAPADADRRLDRVAVRLAALSPYVGVAALVVAPWSCATTFGSARRCSSHPTASTSLAMYGPPAQRIHAFVDPLQDPYYQSTPDHAVRRGRVGPHLAAHRPRQPAGPSCPGAEGGRGERGGDVPSCDRPRTGTPSWTTVGAWACATPRCGCSGSPWRRARWGCGAGDTRRWCSSSAGSVRCSSSAACSSWRRRVLRAPLDLALAFGVGVMFRGPRSHRGSGPPDDGQPMAPDARSRRCGRRRSRARRAAPRRCAGRRSGAWSGCGSSPPTT